MIETYCTTIDKKSPILPPPLRYDFLTECPEEKSVNCSPVYRAERPRPGSPGEIQYVCFDGQFTAQQIPVGAECWCGNGFNGNTAYYWIWEQCMASTCSYCPPTNPIDGFRGGYWRYPDCCVLPLGGFGSYLNCDGTGPAHAGADKLCCSPVCQNIRGKTSQRLGKDYIIELIVNNMQNVLSYIDIESSRNCNYYCCSNSDKINYEADVVFSAASGSIGPFENPALGSIINPHTGESLPLYLENFGPITLCSQSVNKTDLLKVSINIGDRDEECESDAITSMFMDSVGYLPPIKGCRAEMYFNFQDDKNSRLTALLDINSTNADPASFDYYGDNDITKDFKLIPNDTYDKNYPKIALFENNTYFNSLVFESGYYCNKSVLFKYQDSKDKNSYLNIQEIKITYTFNIRNEQLYMRPYLTFSMPNSLGRTADVFSNEEILISEISDFYKEVIFMPQGNNTNCRVKVSLYG